MLGGWMSSSEPQWLQCPGPVPGQGIVAQGLPGAQPQPRQDSSLPRRISKSGQVASMLTSPFNRLKYVSLAFSISSSYDLRNSLPKLFSKPPLPWDDGDIAILTKTNITWLTCARILHSLACKQCVTTRQKEIIGSNIRWLKQLSTYTCHRLHAHCVIYTFIDTLVQYILNTKCGTTLLVNR